MTSSFLLKDCLGVTLTVLQLSPNCRKQCMYGPRQSLENRKYAGTQGPKHDGKSMTVPHPSCPRAHLRALQPRGGGWAKRTPSPSPFTSSLFNIVMHLVVHLQPSQIDGCTKILGGGEPLLLDQTALCHMHGVGR